MKEAIHYISFLFFPKKFISVFTNLTNLVLNFWENKNFIIASWQQAMVPKSQRNRQFTISLSSLSDEIQFYNVKLK